MGVNAADGLAEAVYQQCVAKALPFRGYAVGLDVVTVFVAVAEGLQKLEVVSFDLVFACVIHSKSLKACIGFSKMLASKSISTGESDTISKKYLLAELSSFLYHAIQFCPL